MQRINQDDIGNEKQETIILDLENLRIPRLDQKNRDDKYYGIGWYSIDNIKIKYRYEIDCHRFIIDNDDKDFCLQYVPYTTGKYEEEVKYFFHIQNEKCSDAINKKVLKIFYQPNKYIDYRMNKILLKTIPI